MLSTKSRKTIAALVVGAFIVAGIAIPLTVQADSPFKHHPRHHHSQQIKPEQAAERLSADFGVDKSLIQKYQSEGKTFRDLYRAALYAKAGDTSLESVFALKTDSNTWKDVAQTLNIDRAKVKAVRQEIAGKHIAQKLNIAQAEVESLLDQGYRSHDIVMAGKLAGKSDKTIQDVLAMKKINNRWKDVAAELGVDFKALRAEHTKNITF